MSSEINYVPSFVAFFDVLGFSSLIQRCDDPEVAAKTITELTQALEDAKGRIDSGWSWEKHTLSVRMFSDCVCISVPARIENCDAFFQLLALVQSNFVRRRVCIRGAVAIGKHFANEYLIFSVGLVKAYKIESTIAEFPRIVIPEELWSYVVRNGYDEDIIWFRDTYIWIDPADGRMIVDYLNGMPYDRTDEPEHNGRDIRNHKAFIEESIADFAGQERVVSKYRWMAAYHNSWCADQYPQYPDLLVDADRTIGI